MFLMAFALVSADELSGSIDSQSGNPGSTVTYTLTYKNDRATDITVSSSSTTLSDGTNTISAPTISSVTVPALSSANVSFTFTVPSTPTGIYTGTITGTDTVTSTNTESLGYTLTVNSLDAFTKSTSTLSYDLQTDSETQTFTVTNTGSTTFSTWNLSFASSDGDIGEILDNDDDPITITSSGTTSLAPGSSMTISVVANPDSQVDLGSYSGTLTVSGTGSSTVSSTVSLSVSVNPDICEEGVQGNDFSIDIRNPDSGDDFIAGDTIPMEIKIENNANDDLDIEIEVILYNLDTGDKEKVVRESGSVDEDETETFSFDFELPIDLSDKDDYILYVQVHEDGNEDDSCDYETVKIDIERNDEDAQITDVSVSPSIGLVCGDDYRVSITVESTGADSIDNVYLELRDGDLEAEESSNSFDLGDYNDKDNEERLSFDLLIPSDLEKGTYSLEAILYNTKGSVLDSELIDIEVVSCYENNVTGDLSLSVQDDYTVYGSKLTLSMIVANNGDSYSTISISVEDVSWATLTGSEYLSNLQTGDEVHAYLYFTLDDTTTGKHDIEITVTDNLGNEISQIVTVDFGETNTKSEDSFFTGINDWFSAHAQGSFWIIVDVILVILALVFVRMLFSKK